MWVVSIELVQHNVFSLDILPHLQDSQPLIDMPHEIPPLIGHHTKFTVLTTQLLHMHQFFPPFALFCLLSFSLQLNYFDTFWWKRYLDIIGRWSLFLLEISDEIYLLNLWWWPVMFPFIIMANIIKLPFLLLGDYNLLSIDFWLLRLDLWSIPGSHIIHAPIRHQPTSFFNLIPFVLLPFLNLSLLLILILLLILKLPIINKGVDLFNFPLFLVQKRPDILNILLIQVIMFIFDLNATQSPNSWQPLAFIIIIKCPKPFPRQQPQKRMLQISS